jgi:hypothetical protein
MSTNVRFTRYSEEAFLFGRRAGRDSAITYEFSGRAACAEIRMSFRCLSLRHLSVLFGVSAKTFEIAGKQPE